MRANDLRECYAANLRGERARRGWRQEDLADLVGIPRSTLAATESGRRRLFVEEAVALADALGIPLSALFAGDVEGCAEVREALLGMREP